MDRLTDGHFYEWSIVGLRIFGNLKSLMSTGGQTGERMNGQTEVLQYPVCCFKKSMGFYKHKILLNFFLIISDTCP